MQSSSKVTIVIPVYNGSNYMREAIDSALAQTYENIEILVVNDGSKDGGKTREIALSYGDRIRYFEKENGGVATALNLAIQEMQGEYFSWLSHDDVYYPDKIQAEIEYLQKIGRRDIIVYSNLDFIDSESKVISSLEVEHCDPEKFRIRLVCGGLVHGCTLLIPRECFERLGTFNPALRYTQDYDLWFRFAGACKFHHVSRSLIKARQHPEQGSSKTNIANIKECNNLHIGFLKQLSFEEIKSCWPHSPSAYAIHFSLMMLKYEYNRAALYALRQAAIYFIRCPRMDVFPEMTRFLSVCSRMLFIVIMRSLHRCGFRPLFWFRTAKSYIITKRRP